MDKLLVKAVRHTDGSFVIAVDGKEPVFLLSDFQLLERVASLLGEAAILERKGLHGCSDMTCTECDLKVVVDATWNVSYTM